MCFLSYIFCTCSWGLTKYYFPSLSLGCKAIFLLGGKSRQDPPVAMFLHSGDIVLMAGEARECFHGKRQNFTYYIFFVGII